ncbi:MAG: serine/threonine-protein kinase [Phototrophicaceae bacterium]
MKQHTQSLTERIVDQQEKWVLPIWGIFATLILFFIAQGFPLAYQDRLSDSQTLFSEVLSGWGLPIAFYPTYIITIELMLVGLALGVGLYLVLVSRENRIAAIAGFFLMAWVSTWILPFLKASEIYPLPIAMIDVVGNTLYATLLFTFPTGRLQAKWVRWLLPGGYLLLFILTPINSLADTTPNQGAITQIMLFVLTAGGIILQIVRYRYHATREERQQSKWVFLGFIVSYTVPITFLIIDYFATPIIVNYPAIRLIYRLISSTFFIMIPFAMLPITLLIAITKSRLWDIDLLLNKAAVASGVTLILLIVFSVGIALVQAISGNALFAIGIMLLIIVILYNPLQQAVQNLLDRRIFGLRFDLNQLRRAQIPREITNAGQFSGIIVDDIEFLNVVDRGGMGEIYQGVFNQKLVAIKTMIAAVSKNKLNRVQFDREIQAIGALSHPNIVGLHTTGKVNDMPYMVLDYIEGQSLKTLMKAGQLPIERVINIFHETALALSYLHAQGMVHRDIKPGNIMLSETGEVRLIDFGLVKFVNDTSDPSGEAAIGTIDYMSPEQIRAMDTVDHRADIYAMGIVLYEMLVGKPPFEGDAGQKLFAHLTQPAPDVSKMMLGIPENISEAIQRALLKDPDDRYASIDDFTAIVTLPILA